MKSSQIFWVSMRNQEKENALSQEGDEPDATEGDGKSLPIHFHIYGWESR